MYLLLIFLISPAFGKPICQAAESDVGVEIGNQLHDLVEFSHETGKLLNNSKVFKKVSETLQEADKSILEMEVALKDMQSAIPSLPDHGNYFPEYIKAKSFLRQTRRELNELAHRTVKEVGIMMKLLDNLDKNKSLFLKSAINRLKLLMVETKEKLGKATKIYDEARLSFDNMRTTLDLQHKILQIEILNKEKRRAEYEKNKRYVEKVRLDCQIAAVFTLGLCPLIHHFVNEVPLEEERLELKALNKLTPKFLEKVYTLTEDMAAAIQVMDKEIDLINKWSVSARTFNKNIDDYCEEALRQYEAVKTNFKKGLINLKNDAQNFLDL